MFNINKLRTLMLKHVLSLLSKICTNLTIYYFGDFNYITNLKWGFIVGGSKQQLHLIIGYFYLRSQYLRPSLMR